ncbi:Hypothetical Protein SLY_1118 [Strawberry lethal yellows phytoplasma (CPA) str. NZSb11]|uniref:Uncharacterized protein n=1 Tax=Strawberry lethal yellows phytoplasma (CPA) str. NZSb11 TaxID=980422 RepID=R4S2H8_PHYAS|nr:Hypothetical Protein SLY_1118 [Strawberry lethal yellows phytoplasma (CPA) str. NZSb11]
MRHTFLTIFRHFFYLSKIKLNNYKTKNQIIKSNSKQNDKKTFQGFFSIPQTTNKGVKNYEKNNQSN